MLRDGLRQSREERSICPQIRVRHPERRRDPRVARDPSSAGFALDGTGAGDAVVEGSFVMLFGGITHALQSAPMDRRYFVYMLQSTSRHISVKH